MNTGSEETLHQPIPSFSPAPIPPAAAADVRGVSPVNVLLACLGAIIFPGLGHLVLGRWRRAALLAAAVSAMFALGLFWMQGHLYRPSFDQIIPQFPFVTWEFILSFFPFLANAGLGGIYAVCFFFNIGFVANPSAPSYEFGNTLLFGVGLLNYLIILDAFDIAMRRKS